MHCPFKEKRAKTKREATISYYSQQPCPPKAMTTCFYCKQYYYLWPIKAQGLCIMRLSHILQKWGAPGPTGDQRLTGPVSPLGPRRAHPRRVTHSREAVVTLLLHTPRSDCDLSEFIDLVKAQGMRRSGFRTDQTSQISVRKKQKHNSGLVWFSSDHGPFRWRWRWRCGIVVIVV